MAYLCLAPEFCVGKLCFNQWVWAVTFLSPINLTVVSATSYSRCLCPSFLHLPFAFVVQIWRDWMGWYRSSHACAVSSFRLLFVFFCADCRRYWQMFWEHNCTIIRCSFAYLRSWNIDAGLVVSTGRFWSWSQCTGCAEFISFLYPGRAGYW